MDPHFSDLLLVLSMPIEFQNATVIERANFNLLEMDKNEIFDEEMEN